MHHPKSTIFYHMWEVDIRSPKKPSFALLINQEIYALHSWEDLQRTAGREASSVPLFLFLPSKRLRGHFWAAGCFCMHSLKVAERNGLRQNFCGSTCIFNGCQRQKHFSKPCQEVVSNLTSPSKWKVSAWELNAVTTKAKKQSKIILWTILTTSIFKGTPLQFFPQKNFSYLWKCI